MKWLLSGRLRAIAFSIVLFCLNAYICRELFTAGFISNLSSNEGVFVSLARFFQEHPTDWRWMPWFDAGMPMENAYQPLLPVTTAMTGWLAGWPIEQAFHFVLAVALCAGPVTLFWFVFDWSESLVAGAGAGLAYSLLSPAQWFIPILRIHERGGEGSLRLFNLVHYAEDPHVVALTLVPLALLFLRRRSFAAAVVACAAVVATNAFGAVDLAIGGLCIVLAGRRGVRDLALTGLVAWCWISPWLTPSLMRQIAGDQWGARGYLSTGSGPLLGVVMTVAVFVGIWLVTRRLSSSFERFAILFAFPICAIPVAAFGCGITAIPQATRYQLEFEMAIAIVIGCVAARLAGGIRRRRAVAVLAGALVVCGVVWQTATSRQFARGLIRPVDITGTIQYKSDQWLASHLPGQRAMISGDVEYLINVISDNPQMAGGHEPTAPNWVLLFAVYTIYTGTNAGALDADYSLLWLKAFGNQAVTVPGEKSRENYHPVAHPHKFDGLLPVLWHDEDDTIFAVPQRSPSLAHVVPRDAVVARQPIHGLDVDEVRRYVAALDNPALPLAELAWIGPSHAKISATMSAGQVLSVQENYAPGWRATVSGREVPIRKDGIGLMVVDPQCSGDCGVELTFGVSTEGWLCRLLSLAATMFLGLAVWRGYRERRWKPPSA